METPQHPMKACITGGCGFVGFRIALALLDSLDVSVVLLDLSPPSPALLRSALSLDALTTSSSACNVLEDGRGEKDRKREPQALPTQTALHGDASSILPGISYVRVDLADSEAATKVMRIAFRDADVIFHVASYGMSGASQLNRLLTRKVNVEGTRAVVAAAKQCKVEKIVYTSTYNVVFGGQSISGGTEAMPYFPLDKHPDEYSRSKAQAEMIVLASNGHTLARSSEAEEEPGVLKTCAIRPAAIWGAGEMRHQPRTVKSAQRGLLCFLFGRADAKADFVHVDNLVQAHILAASALDEAKRSVAAGQAYFISDGEERAINSFDFFGEILEGLGYEMPTLRLPLALIYALAYVSEMVCVLCSRFLFPMEPILTRAETLKAGVNHWFVISKARSELGYRPEERGREEVIEWFRARGFAKRSASRVPQLLSISIVIAILAFLGWMQSTVLLPNRFVGVSN